MKAWNLYFKHEWIIFGRYFKPCELTAIWGRIYSWYKLPKWSLYVQLHVYQRLNDGPICGSQGFGIFNNNCSVTLDLEVPCNCKLAWNLCRTTNYKVSANGMIWKFYIMIWTRCIRRSLAMLPSIIGMTVEFIDLFTQKRTSYNYSNIRSLIKHRVLLSC